MITDPRRSTLTYGLPKSLASVVSEISALADMAVSIETAIASDLIIRFIVCRSELAWLRLSLRDTLD